MRKFSVTASSVVNPAAVAARWNIAAVTRLTRVLLVILGGVTALAVLIEVFVRNPTAAAVVAAIMLALADWWRRRRRFLTRSE